MEQQIRKLPVSYPILTSAVIAALQNCESSATRLETSRAESFTEEPCPKSNNLAMPLVRTRETTISPCVGLAPSLTCVLEKKGTTADCCAQQYCCNSPRVLSTRWVHTLGHLESINSQRCDEERLELLVTLLLLCRTASDRQNVTFGNSC